MQAIFARGINQEFGLKGDLPWGYNAIDLAHFKEKTLGKTLLCGKNTYNALPAAVFKGRTVKMVGRGEDIFDGDHSNSIIIGGTSLLTLYNLERCDTVWTTHVKGVFEADTYLNGDEMCVFESGCLTEVLHDDEDIRIEEHTMCGVYYE